MYTYETIFILSFETNQTKRKNEGKRRRKKREREKENKGEQFSFNPPSNRDASSRRQSTPVEKPERLVR